MKTIITAIPVCLCLFILSSCHKEQLHSSDITIENNDKASALSVNGLNDYYEDDFPEWGTTGTNWPAPALHPTYSPRPELYLTLEITNSLKDVLPAGSAYSPSPLIHVQWRKIKPNGYPDSKWYNYHPEMREYNQLRLDTLQNWHPDLNSWYFNLNSKALPKGDIEFRTRLLLYPLNTTDRASATLWSTSDSRTNNYFGYDDTGVPNPGDNMVQVNVSIDLDVSINNFSGKQVDHFVVNAFGKTSTFYSSSSGIVRGEFKPTVKLNEPTPLNYSATIEAYSLTGKIGSGTKEISNTIYISSSAGSNPSVYFKNYAILDVFPAN